MYQPTDIVRYRVAKVDCKYGPSLLCFGWYDLYHLTMTNCENIKPAGIILVSLTMVLLDIGHVQLKLKHEN